MKTFIYGGLLISLANFSVSTVSAYTLEETMDNYQTQQQTQSINNLNSNLSNISNSIDAQTRLFKDAYRQQVISELDPACVSNIAAQVREKDGSAEIWDEIRDTEEKMQEMDLSDPSRSNEWSSYLGGLYKQIGALDTQLFNVVVQYCPKGAVAAVAQTLDASQPSGILCNGKSWNSCQAGTEFYCPPSGDAECVLNQGESDTPPVVINEIAKASLEQPKTSPAAEAVATKTPETVSESPSTFVPGLIPRFWSWLMNLFSF